MRRTVSVEMLTDLHPAYRTLASGPEGQRAAYSSTDVSHEWQLPVPPERPVQRPPRPQPRAAQPAAQPAAPTGSTPATGSTTGSTTGADADLGTSALVQMSAVGAVLLIVAAGAILLRRRLHRPDTSPLDEGATRATPHHHHEVS